MAGKGLLLIFVSPTVLMPVGMNFHPFLACLNKVQEGYCTAPGIGVSVCKMLKFLRDGQGADRQAILSCDRSCPDCFSKQRQHMGHVFLSSYSVLVPMALLLSSAMFIHCLSLISQRLKDSCQDLLSLLQR